VVLFVADGLRAESIYGHPDRTPYLSKAQCGHILPKKSHQKFNTIFDYIRVFL
jgi:hypothetical protein